MEEIMDLLLPAASAVEVYVQKNSGHGMTLHKNAVDSYQAQFAFLEKYGL